MHVALFNRVAHHVALYGAGAAQRVVASARVGGDGQQGIASRGDQARPGGQIDIGLGANRILSAVAILVVVRVEEERVGRLVAFDIDNTQHLALLHLVNPWIAGKDSGVVDGAGRIERTHR